MKVTNIANNDVAEQMRLRAIDEATMSDEALYLKYGNGNAQSVQAAKQRAEKKIPLLWTEEQYREYWDKQDQLKREIEQEQMRKAAKFKMNQEDVNMLVDPITTYDTGLPTTPDEDIINAPHHYHKGGMDVYEIMQAKYTKEKYEGFCLGNVNKYVIRYEEKNTPLADLRKARFNLDRLIESIEGIKYVPEHKKTKDGESNGI